MKIESLEERIVKRCETCAYYDRKNHYCPLNDSLCADFTWCNKHAPKKRSVEQEVVALLRRFNTKPDYGCADCLRDIALAVDFDFDEKEV